LLEHAPFCERDVRKPADLETHDEKGDFKVLIKRDGMIYPYHYASHPFDLVGWDGYHYPFALSIHDFEPITGRVHQPPPVHQTFETSGYVICSFVPRLYDYHPQAIPAPYNHSNVDSDEVIYYVDGDFMSRKRVEKGMITLHPIGIPHGPHPGTIEKSIGQKETKELAVMVDTFKPLMLTTQALKIEDKEYYRSWIE
jgi:homogentisate 1,2-dioxygenase